MSSTQLTDFNNFHTSHIIFSKPEVGSVAGQKISFKRIRIGTRYPDGSSGDLIIATPPQLLSFGLQESRDMATNAINGYTFPLCLWSRNGPTEDEQKFVNVFNVISDVCKNYLLEHKEEIEKYDLDASDLKKFNPLFWKMEKGKIVEGRGPMLYSKVLMSKKQNKISTIFVNEDTNQEVDPFELVNKQCHVTAAIKFESIFIGNKISLQVKLFEVVYKLKDNMIRGLLRPNASKRDEHESTFVIQHEKGEDELVHDEDDDASIIVEDELTDNHSTIVQQASNSVNEEAEEVVTAMTEIKEPEPLKKKGRATKSKK